MSGKDPPNIVFLEHQFDSDANPTGRQARLRIINRQAALHRHSRTRDEKEVCDAFV